MIHFSTDTHYRVVGFPYHDGSLEVLSIAGYNLHFAIHATSGETHEIQVENLSEVRIDDLRPKNIVHSIRLLPAAAAGLDRVVVDLLRDRLCFEPHFLAPGDAVLHLESSYGVEILAICRTIVVIRR